MKRTFYVLSDGDLRREGHTIILTTKEGKKVVPIETTDALCVFAEVSMNKAFLRLLTQHQIPIHFFGYHSEYLGSYYPREQVNSGQMVLMQSLHHLEPELRLDLARSFVEGAMANMLFVLRTYASRGKEVRTQIEAVEKLRERVKWVRGVQGLMAIEGQARDTYYSAFDSIVEDADFRFECRSRRPPKNRINAMISLGNTLLYSVVLTEIYKTYLDPRIGFLHSTTQRAFSLNLDIAEVFKPLIVDRAVFSVINRREVKPKDFYRSGEGVYLGKTGQKKFIQAFEKRLSETVYHKKQKRNVSYRRLIKLECYKLYHHFLDEERYEPYIRTR